VIDAVGGGGDRKPWCRLAKWMARLPRWNHCIQVLCSPVAWSEGRPDSSPSSSSIARFFPVVLFLETRWWLPCGPTPKIPALSSDSHHCFFSDIQKKLIIQKSFSNFEKRKKVK
jgi:hypothetical protein